MVCITRMILLGYTDCYCWLELDMGVRTIVTGLVLLLVGCEDYLDTHVIKALLASGHRFAFTDDIADDCTYITHSMTLKFCG